MIHSKLKRVTLKFHNELETKLQSLLSDDLSLAQYAAVQKAFYGFYRPIEAKLALIRGWDDPELGLENRFKLSLLAGDLNSPSIGPTDLEALPNCNCLPVLETVAEALGCLYVLEGSTLGGKVLTTHLKRVLPIDEESGCSFFNSYGRDVGRMWTSFLKVLTRHCEKYRDDDAVVCAASQTFTALDRWFTSAA